MDCSGSLAAEAASNKKVSVRLLNLKFVLMSRCDKDLLQTHPWRRPKDGYVYMYIVQMCNQNEKEEKDGNARA